MKGLIVFVALVLGYSTINMIQLKAGASTYKDGINAYLKHQTSVQGHIVNDGLPPKRGPAIELKTKRQ